MSYPRDLDEYTTAELAAEIDRRADCRRRDVCDYCGRPPGSKPCKFPARHACLASSGASTSGDDHR